MSARILVVDDVLPNVKLLEAKLTSEYFDVVCATSGEEALGIMEQSVPDLVLLDVMMPGLDGFEVCRRIKANPKTAHIPVVMVTALDHPTDRVTGIEAGADDFLTKPVQDVALFARVRSLVRLKMLMDELRMREATGETLGIAGERTEFMESTNDARILVVDNQERSAMRMMEALDPLGSVIIDNGGAGVAERAAAYLLDLVIVNLGLEGVDGLRICSQLRSLEATRQVPILIVVDDANSRELVRGFEIGVNDYLVRPVDRNELVARARTQIRRKRYSDRLRWNVHMNYQMATRDALTGLFNRHFLSNHLTAAMESARQNHKPASLLVLDIDYFKNFNDSHGHIAGDVVLKEFAERIARNIRGIDLAARFGGEEFVVFLPDTDKDAALAIAERLRREVAETPFTHEGQFFDVTTSIGVATLDDSITSVTDFIRRADIGLYEAKAAGRNRVVYADEHTQSTKSEPEPVQVAQSAP